MSLGGYFFPLGNDSFTENNWIHLVFFGMIKKTSHHPITLVIDTKMKIGKCTPIMRKQSLHL